MSVLTSERVKKSLSEAQKAIEEATCSVAALGLFGSLNKDAVPELQVLHSPTRKALENLGDLYDTLEGLIAPAEKKAEEKTDEAKEPIMVDIPKAAADHKSMAEVMNAVADKIIEHVEENKSAELADRLKSRIPEGLGFAQRDLETAQRFIRTLVFYSDQIKDPTREDLVSLSTTAQEAQYHLSRLGVIIKLIMEKETSK
jgi:hypothetical protein